MNIVMALPNYVDIFSFLVNLRLNYLVNVHLSLKYVGLFSVCAVSWNVVGLRCDTCYICAIDLDNVHFESCQ